MKMKKMIARTHLSVSTNSYSMLLVDDDPLIIKGTGNYLQHKGFNVSTADNGKTAIDLINKTFFDLVITDLIMDQVDGFQVLKQVKKINPETIVIILTGHGNMNAVIDALRLGADDYLHKPCDAEEMDFRVLKCLEKIESLRKIKQTEEELKKSYEELEQRVKERTEELEVANNKLKIERTNIEEANIALKVLLNRRNEDKSELEQNMLFNIRELVLPYIGKLKMSRLNKRQKSEISAIEYNLNEITSPLVRKLATNYAKLTPAEIQVANFIKHGKTSKEIAEFMCMSDKTINIHRYNIRKKIGLQNKKLNLRTHLLSIQ